MSKPTLKTVAVVGTGVIGRSWILVFARAGCQTRIFDQDPQQVKKAMIWLDNFFAQDVKERFMTASEAKRQKKRVSVHTSLEETLKGAEYIQESGPERLDIKRSLFASLDKASEQMAIIASSTSTLDIEEIAAGLRGKARCITAHPFNPPHVLPAVEMMPTRNGDPAVFEAAAEFMKSIGQKPVRMNYFVTGYLANRIQAAVVREALHLVNKGVADVEAVDTVISEALGLRWALFGNFGTNHTNADQGIREYYARYSQAYKDLMNDLDPTLPPFDPEMIERIGKGVDVMMGPSSVADLCRWRDRMVRKIRSLKEQNPRP